MLDQQELFPRRFLNAASLPSAKGAVEIASVEQIELGEQKQLKAVVYFSGLASGLPLNKTNFSILTDAFGFDEATWLGKTILLRKERVPFQGHLVDSVRVVIPDGVPF